MAIRGYPDLIIELDDSGGTPRDISSYVRTFSGFPKTRTVEEVTGSHEDADRHADVGITKKGQITLGGPYDTASNGLVDLTEDAEGGTRTLRMDFNGTGSNRPTVEAIIVSADRTPSVDALTQYQVVVQPTGAITKT